MDEDEKVREMKAYMKDTAWELMNMECNIEW